MFLSKIVTKKQQEIETLLPKNEEFFSLSSVDFLKQKRCRKQQILKQFADQKKLKLIAEVKRKSPSRGEIYKDFNPTFLAKKFTKNGASSLSVLTDQSFFGGSFQIFEEVKKTTSLPLLRKDFILEPIQIYQSHQIQADILLLISSILTATKLAQLLKIAIEQEFLVLLENHSLEDLEKSKQALNQLQTNFVDFNQKFSNLNQLILFGINNRNLETFEIDFEACLKLQSQIPTTFQSVAESAILQKEQLETLEKEGFDFVLIGEGLAKNSELLEWFKLNI